MIPACPVEKGTEDKVRKFGDNECCDEGFPAVYLGFLLTDFVDVTAVDEHWLQLSDDSWCNKDEAA